MSEFSVSLGVIEPAQEPALVQAIDRFARWRVETGGQGWKQRAAPDLMIRTVCDHDGQLKKAITFQDHRWADIFLRIWQETQLDQLDQHRQQAS